MRVASSRVAISPPISAGLILEINVRELLAATVNHDKAGVLFLDTKRLEVATGPTYHFIQVQGDNVAAGHTSIRKSHQRRAGSFAKFAAKRDLDIKAAGSGGHVLFAR
jgi:hypothetical protein